MDNYGCGYRERIGEGRYDIWLSGFTCYVVR